MARTLLIDGDIFAYRVACSEEKTVNFDGTFTTTADAEQGRQNLDDVLSGFKDRLGADAMVVALTPTGDQTNFRRTILPSYKERRVEVRRPMILEEMKAHLIEAYAAKLKPTLEADDVLGILATNPVVIKGEKIIVTVDKDLRTVPGLHWNPTKEDQPVRVNQQEADRFHLFQTLMGDKVDGYSGCPGIGPVKANRILTEPPTMCDEGVWWWAQVVETYESKGLTEADALVQAQVARICRHSDFNYITQRAIPWHPSST